ncbi:MAG: alpha/beta fold hydrolase [Acidimicrobiales bacterium]
MSDFPPALAHIGIFASQYVELDAGLTHHELYTADGLLSLLWHHTAEPATAAVLYCGGALGGVLGPGGLFHQLGRELADAGVADGLRVGYRVPNDLDRCVIDTVAAAELAGSVGVERFVVVGHSFGGAVAISAGVALGERCAGVVALATQTAGCEGGEALAESKVPVLLIHGDADDILPHLASQLVHMLTGGELVILPGVDHRFSGAVEDLRTRLIPWLSDRFDVDLTTPPDKPD